MDLNEYMPRRKFLTAAAGAGLSGVALLTGDAFGATGAANDLGKVTHTQFAPHVGTSIKVQTADGNSIALQLVSATELPKATRKRAKRTAFSLLFRGDLKPVLTDGMYNIQHAKLGSFTSVFLAYVGPNKKKDASYYEAIFN